MADSRWMIYGATGFTGRLLVEEAIARGHRPIIAGRSAERVQALAQQHGLEFRVFGSHDSREIAANLRAAAVELVLHAAGPFIHTSAPMIDACLRTKTHYLDITGEIPVFENTIRHHALAQARGVLLMSGVGFDIVPSDCLSLYLADQVEEPFALELGISGLGGADSKKGAGVSAGTLRSVLEMTALGGQVRRGSRLQPIDLGMMVKSFSFPFGQREAMAISWGDVSTAWHTTGVPNVTTYMTFPLPLIKGAQSIGWLVQRLLRIDAVRQRIAEQIDGSATGPSDEALATARAHIYGHMTGRDGSTAEAWIETAEGYQFTRLAAVRIVERVLDSDLTGALTPARAFGADFALEIEGTVRRDRLDEVPA
ncbi:MAG: saccharopine dehydrogenase family protein [Phototrophicaceae bacterium]